MPVSRDIVDTTSVPDAVFPTVDNKELGSNVRYPEEARKNGIEGNVTVSAWIDEDGRVIKTRIDASDNELLSQAAADAVRATRFTPGSQDGKKLRLWVSIVISFKLN